MKIRLLLLGKIRRPELRALFDDYLQRIRHHATIEAIELRDSAAALKKLNADRAATVVRSEEHTSELQSLRHLVCRLLLEKKKKRRQPRRAGTRIGRTGVCRGGSTPCP